MLNVFQRIGAVMADISFVAKGDKQVNGQYSFVSHDAVTAAIRPHLVKHGLVYYTHSLEFTENGNRVSVKMVLRFVNIDAPEEYFDVHTFGYGVDQQDKGPGKAMSYAVKYALLKTFSLETGDDPERDFIDHMPAPKTTFKEAVVEAERKAEATPKPKWSKNTA